MTKRKLSDDQIEIVASAIRKGLTWLEASQYVETKFNISIDRTSLARHYPELQQAVRDRKLFRLIEAGEVVERTLKSASETILERLEALRNEAKRVQAELEDPNMVPGTPAYKDLSSRLRAIDTAISSYQKPLQDALKATSDEQAGLTSATDDEDTATSFLNYMDVMENVLKDTKKGINNN